MIDLLLIPRPITRILLLSIGIAAGQLLWLFLPVKLIAYVSGLAAPFCLLAASAVWGMREKVDVAFDGDHLSAADFRKARAASNSVRRKAMFRAAWVVCAALLAGSPLVSSQIAGAIWHWMVIAGGVGVAEACYSYLVANHLEEQIRSLRDKKVLAAKEREMADELAARIRGSAGAVGEPLKGWSVGRTETTMS